MGVRKLGVLVSSLEDMAVAELGVEGCKFLEARRLKDGHHAFLTLHALVGFWPRSKITILFEGR